MSGYESFRRGHWVGHVYPLPGLYTATLTATNSYGTITATMPVYIYTTVATYLPLIYKGR